MKRFGLKWQLLSFAALLLVSALAVQSVLVLNSIRNQQIRQMESTLKHQSDAASLHVRQMFITGERMEPSDFLARQGQQLAVELGMRLGLPVILYDNEGKERGNSSPIGAGCQESQAMEYALTGKTVYVTDGTAVEYYAPIRTKSEMLGVVQMQYSISDDLIFYGYVRRLMLYLGIAVTVVALALAYMYVHRQTTSIRKLIDAASSIRQNNFLQMPILRRKDELGELGTGIFEMSRTIEAQIERQKQFIGNISHELKTPITSIKAYSELVTMYGDDPELRKDASERMTKEIDRLTDLIHTVLQLSRLEKYEFDYNPEPLDTRECLHEICERMKGKADKFGIAIYENLSPAVIWADKMSFVHVFINLLDNAVKYNVPNGEIHVSSAVRRDEAIEITIRDTGIGIPEPLRDKVFEPFFTVNRDRSRESGGAGLGLSLVKSLVEKHNGTIRLTDDGTPGTTVIVTFPVHRQAQ